MIDPGVALLFALLICAVLIIIAMYSSISVKDERIKRLIQEVDNNSRKYNKLLDDSSKLIQCMTRILNTKNVDNYSYEVRQCRELIEEICWRNIRANEVNKQEGINW